MASANASAAATARLQKELRLISKDPPPHVHARPNPSDILEWHYVLQGSPGTSYEGGWYHGKLKFPPDYPFRPPSVYMLTPNGRFETNKRICMSMSDYHPESWNPLWSVSSILTGLLSFMSETATTAGSIESTDTEKRDLARRSMEHNAKSPMFRKLFSDLLKTKSKALSKDPPSKARRAQEARPKPEAEDQIKKAPEDGMEVCATQIGGVGNADIVSEVCGGQRGDQGVAKPSLTSRWIATATAVAMGALMLTYVWS